MPVFEMNLQQRERIQAHIRRFENLQITVVGDLGLDEYIDGDVRRISPEAPVPVLDVRAVSDRVGLAGNVAQNILALGGKVHLVGVLGEDAAGKTLSEKLLKVGVSADSLVVDNSRPTIRKIRVMSHQHHMVRVDFEERKSLSPEIQKSIVAKTEKALASSSGLIIEDYGKGVLSRESFSQICQIASNQKIPVFVDPCRSHAADFYQGASLLKPNAEEAIALAGWQGSQTRDLFADPTELNKDGISPKLAELLKDLQKKSGAESVVITLGQEGMVTLKSGKFWKIPTLRRPVFDVTGAGDTVIATLSLALISGLELQEACMVANCAASYVVGQVGSVPCPTDKLLEAINLATP